MPSDIREQHENEERTQISSQIDDLWERVEMLGGEIPPYPIDQFDKKHPDFDVCQRCGQYRWMHAFETPRSIQDVRDRAFRGCPDYLINYPVPQACPCHCCADHEPGDFISRD